MHVDIDDLAPYSVSRKNRKMCQTGTSLKLRSHVVVEVLGENFGISSSQTLVVDNYREDKDEQQSALDSYCDKSLNHSS